VTGYSLCLLAEDKQYQVSATWHCSSEFQPQEVRNARRHRQHAGGGGAPVVNVPHIFFGASSNEIQNIPLKTGPLA